MAKGKVVQVIGTVVDIEFPPEELPGLYNAVEIPMDGSKLVLEVQQHIGNNWVRCLALTPTEGLKRGVEAIDTGRALAVPVGRGCLGRLFSVFGEPLDNLGEVKAQEKWPIHRPPPPFADQETTPQMLETGLKVLDMLLPRYVEMEVYHALLETLASEQSARMVAMRNATDNANELTQDLTLAYNKARQEMITKELLDMMGTKVALGE